METDHVLQAKLIIQIAHVQHLVPPREHPVVPVQLTQQVLALNRLRGLQAGVDLKRVKHPLQLSHALLVLLVLRVLLDHFVVVDFDRHLVFDLTRSDTAQLLLIGRDDSFALPQKLLLLTGLIPQFRLSIQPVNRAHYALSL